MKGVDRKLWPARHPLTGAPIVSADIVEEHDNTTVRVESPTPPTRAVVTEWDDDGPVAWRRLSDEEFLLAAYAHERALARWNETRGLHVVKGRVTIRGKFVAADGATAEGVLEGASWHWLVAAAGARDE